MKLLKGEIRYIDNANRLIELKAKERIYYLYLTRSLMNRFKVLLKEGYYIEAETIDNGEVKDNKIIYEIISFTKIIYVYKDQTKVFYDMRNIKKGIVDVINNMNYKMFIDLEFTMPEYGTKGTFKSEIIQYGYIIEDQNGQIVERKNALIKPTFGSISKRTLEFINKDIEEFNEAIEPLAFYDTLKEALKKYQPTIIVWGSNDIMMLDRFYQDYKLEPLTTRASFVNIMQIMKNYLSLKYDIGLFKAKSFFVDDAIEEQLHDASGDALMTYEVFHLFKDYIKN